MDWFYARVSSTEQNLSRQLDVAKEKGFDDKCIFADKMSGTKEDRPALKDLLSRLREGDTVTVLSLDRLARSALQLYKLADDFQKQGVELISLKENIDTSTAQGKLFFGICASFAEFERSLIKERQAEGIACAQKRGVAFGRPATDSEQMELAIALYKEGSKSVAEISKATGVSRSALYRKLKALTIVRKA